MNFETAFKYPHLNRYKSVLPFSHNIPSDDYLNASLMDLNDTTYNQVIAAQAPVPAAFETFYRCILNQNVKVVVMLCNLIEDFTVKADQYWPQLNTAVILNKPNTKEFLIVQNMFEVQDRNIVFRTIQITFQNRRHTFVQIHYTAWPDGSVPRNYLDIYDVIEKANRVLNNNDMQNLVDPKWFRDYSNTIAVVNVPQNLLDFNANVVNNTNTNPIAVPEFLNKSSTMLVHCSAGIGRTGTFIAIHYGLHLIHNQKDVNILSIVTRMRESRPYMVQNAEQAGFIYYFLTNYKKIWGFTSSINLHKPADPYFFDQ